MNPSKTHPQNATLRKSALLLPVVLLLAGGCMPKKLTIVTQPAGAEVYWDNEVLGPSPCQVTLPEDEGDFPELHVIECRMKGYQPAIDYYTDSSDGLGLGGTKTLRIEMTKLPDGFDESIIPDVQLAEDNSSGKSYGNRVVCEIRLVRVSDGRVICQASVMGYRTLLMLLAEQLADEFKNCIPANLSGRVVMGELRNRRKTERGRVISEELTPLLSREIGFANPMGPVYDIQLRDRVGEDQLDLSKIVTNPSLKDRMMRADYIILGGLAEAVDPYAPKPNEPSTGKTPPPKTPGS